MSALIGSTFGDRYLIERKLGEGGFGAVYAAQHLRTGARVAIKVLGRELAVGEAERRRFKDEVLALGQLNHPHIVQIHDCGEAPRPFLVMEYLSGQDLESRLVAAQRLPLATVVELAEQVGSALSAAHQAGIVHRDIKPQNIFLVSCPTAFGSELLCKVLDFGIAKFCRTAALTAQSQLLGTPAYMAPEAIRKDSDIDWRADQWALGVVVYRALAGCLPFEGSDVMSTLYKVLEEEPPPLGARCPELPAHVSAAVARALSKDRAQRFPAIADFIAALRGRSSQGTAAAPSRSRRVWLGGASLMGLAVGLVVVGYAAQIIYGSALPQRPSLPPPAPPQPEAAPQEERPAKIPPPAAVEADEASAPRSAGPPRPPKAARAHPAQAAPKAPRPLPNPVRTDKEDIDELFGRHYLDAVSEPAGAAR